LRLLAKALYTRLVAARAFLGLATEPLRCCEEGLVAFLRIGLRRLRTQALAAGVDQCLLTAVRREKGWRQGLPALLTGALDLKISFGVWCR
jgi:hypothetical protein